jgi:YHS domain-containing protein
MTTFKWLLSLSVFAVLLICNQLGISEAQASELKRVPTEQVCMVNDAFMGKKQIPIPVQGKTYYGCCQMCVSTLTNDAAERQAIDPVSRQAVDKATAIIGALPDGSVFYFENEANLKTYVRQGQ